MADVASLLAEFLDELQEGAMPDALAFVNRAESDEARRELAAAIEAVLAVSGANAGSQAPTPPATNLDQAQRLVAAALDESGVPVGGYAWGREVARKRSAAGISMQSFADRLLELAGFVASEGRRQSAAQWLSRIEEGTISASAISDAARSAIGQVVGLENSASTDLQSALAFRLSDEASADVERQLHALADELAAAMAGDSPLRTSADDVDDWFRAGRV